MKEAAAERVLGCCDGDDDGFEAEYGEPITIIIAIITALMAACPKQASKLRANANGFIGQARINLACHKAGLRGKHKRRIADGIRGACLTATDQELDDLAASIA